MFDQIFENLGMPAVEHIGDTRYRGKNGKYYNIVAEEHSVKILEADGTTDPMRKVLGYYRIYPDYAMKEICEMSLASYMNDREAYLQTYKSIGYQEAYIWGTLKCKLGPKELENLCYIFYESVRVGGDNVDLTEQIKEVIKIHSMPPSMFSHPELHELLLKVPDTYYDFILGTERNTQRNPGLQERYIKFLKKYPNSKSSDVIIFGSMLNADMNYKDEWIKRVIDIANSDNTFALYGIKHGDNEVVHHDNKHDWHIFMMYLGKLSYTFRQVKSLVFIDYMDCCYRAGMVSSVGDDIAMIHDIGEQQLSAIEIYAGLIRYLERLVRAANYHNIVAFVKPEFIELYEQNGFELSEDEIIDNPYEGEGAEERAFMWKKL